MKQVLARTPVYHAEEGRAGIIAAVKVVISIRQTPGQRHTTILPNACIVHRVHHMGKAMLIPQTVVTA